MSQIKQLCECHSLRNVFNVHFSVANLVFQISDFLAGLDDLLLNDALLTLEVHKLPLHVVVVLALGGDLLLQVLEVLEQLRIDELDVLVIHRRQVVVHHCNLLPEQIDLTLVLAKVGLAVGDDPLDLLHVLLERAFWVADGLVDVLAQVLV